MYDMRVYGGNSGGPVYFEYLNRRPFGSTVDVVLDYRGIAGIVQQDISMTGSFESYFEQTTRRDPLGLAIVIPSEFIKQTIQKMLDDRFNPVP